MRVWLQDLNLHVVHIIFAELKHAVAQRVGLLKLCLNVAFFCTLVLQPDRLEVLFNVLALEEVAEN